MNTPDPFARRQPPVEATRDYRLGGGAPASQPDRCKMALVHGSGPCPFEALAALLRHRLRLAALLFCAGAGAFLVKSFWDQNDRFFASPLTMTLHTAVVAVSAVLVGVLTSRHCLHLWVLRAAELTFFGMTTVFFAWLHYFTYVEAQPLLAGAGSNDVLTAYRLITGANLVRWVLLLVIYGTFIPNTWRRSAAVVGVIAATPLVLTAAMAVFDASLRPYLADTLIILAIGVGFASAVAVFGSYKIDELSHQAREARTLGQYRLKKLLGTGGMGEVHLAEHVLLRRPCAIKLIRPEQAGDPTNLSRFEREVRATATLTHPNTVEIFDYGRTDDGTFYYVMEYLPGLGLDDLVERHGPLPPERAAHFLAQVCGALHEAHAIGLTHRDVKPSNILACERGGVRDVAKLLDFGLVQDPGLAKEADRLTIQGTILGSPPYMSPEQAAGKPVDGRSDIYSLGGVAYFLLTGQAPFVRDTALQLLLAHAHDPVVPPSAVRAGVPADLEQVVLRCLEKDPAKRFTDVRGLKQALAACACAGRWTEERAETWWSEAPAKDTLPELPAAATSREVTVSMRA